MEESAEIAEAWERFCDRLSASDVASFDDLVSAQAVLIIGTAPEEFVETRDRMRFGFETEGVHLEPDDPRGYEEGSLGRLVDRPRLVLPDGSGIDTRVTAVMRQEDGRWKLVHAHFSAGVPDEEVVALQERWSG